MIEVSDLFIYPVKSCRGIKVNSWVINEYGFKYDRFWMLIDDRNKKYITQREYPKLALVSPTIQETDDGGLLKLTNPENDQELILPLIPNEDDYPQLSVSACEEILIGHDCGEESSKWFSDFLDLGFKVRMVFKSTKEQRLIVKNLPSRDELLKQPETAFSDGYPFLMLSEESLSDLNERLSSPVTIRNFRPNIVVKGCENPFEEDTWKKIIVGEDNIFFVVARCTRCVMTTVNPNTGMKEGLDPLKTLQSYRRVDKGAKYRACFGMNVIHHKSGITLNVGDPISVITTGEHMREK